MTVFYQFCYTLSEKKINYFEKIEKMRKKELLNTL